MNQDQFEAIAGDCPSAQVFKGTRYCCARTPVFNNGPMKTYPGRAPCESADGCPVVYWLKKLEIIKE